MATADREPTRPQNIGSPPEGPRDPETLPILDPAEVGYARVVRQLADNGDVQEDAVRALPSAPLDWHGIAGRMAKAAPDRRKNLLNRWVENQGGKPVDQAKIIRALQEAEATPADEKPTTPPPFRIKVMGARELKRAEFKIEWLIKGLLVADQPAVIGGPKKGQKSNSMLDLAVSLASGKPFLNHFEVPRPLPVLMLTGESGGFATQSTVFRACDSKGIDLDELEGNIFIGFELPKLSVDEQVQAVVELIREHGIKVVIIDPLYLCLTSGSINGKPVDTTNLFQVGPLLLEVSRMCLEAGATPLLVHHNKITVQDPYEPPELANLAYAGIQEFARQWLLLGRRSKYKPGTPIHELWLTVGGSAGHSGEWAVDIDEGLMDHEFKGRRWQVSVRRASEVYTEESEAKDAAKREKEVKKEVEQIAKHHMEEDKILKAVAGLGNKCSRSAAYGGAGLSAKFGNPALDRLLASGQLITTMVEVPKGRGKEKVLGVGLPEPRQTPINPD